MGIFEYLWYFIIYHFRVYIFYAKWNKNYFEDQYYTI